MLCSVRVIVTCLLRLLSFQYIVVHLCAFVKAPLCDNLDLDLESYGGSKPD